MTAHRQVLVRREGISCRQRSGQAALYLVIKPVPRYENHQTDKMLCRPRASYIAEKWRLGSDLAESLIVDAANGGDEVATARRANCEWRRVAHEKWLIYLRLTA